MRLYLVRHGQTIENIKKITMGQKHGKLTYTGIKQAELLGKQLKGYDFDIIYCSDLKRASDTLKRVKKYLPKIPVIYTKDLRETKLGELEGKRWDKISMEDIPGDFMTRKAKGGESLQGVKKRINRFINLLNKNHANDKVLIVTHAGTIKMFLSILQKIPVKKIFKTVDLKNTSICEIEVTPSETKVYYINKTDHLNNKKIDIIVGLPSYNEEDSIRKVLETIDKGLKKFYDPHKCLIVNFDSGSKDDTKSVFLNTETTCLKKYYNTGRRSRGKGINLIKLFNLCVELDAEYIATIDSDIYTINENWPRLLLQPLIKKKCDYVVPVYTRNRFEGSNTNHLTYPLIYAIFGVKIRQPIGGDFGLSKKFCKFLLKQPLIESTLKYGIDIFMTCHAVGGGFKIAESYLGRKFHKQSFPKIVPMSKQILSSAIHTTKIYQSKKRKAKPEIIKSRRRINIDRLSMYSHKRKVPTLLKRMKFEFIKNEKDYQKLLGNSFVPISEVIRSGKPIISDKHWTTALSLFLKYCYKRNFDEKLIPYITNLVIPIFIWRVISFWVKIEKEKPQKIEAMIEKQAELLKRKL
ncbi:MAG TPA: glycosyltransferase [Candidatus Nealsonbacteria bacterium]|uniref:Glycosyltransferase 2-like domain-containing protein n=1 Tax=marine sediment metagenome TaxID=412755 RepID=A0A0F9VSD5_9ZZZZ|nr:glycosyltransferase [Candidatus Nealsonbacteria bacterium]HEB46530.1 glycosyltransferase [Candidatus Nealsonbacteria bacterium]